MENWTKEQVLKFAEFVADRAMEFTVRDGDYFGITPADEEEESWYSIEDLMDEYLEVNP